MTVSWLDVHLEPIIVVTPNDYRRYKLRQELEALVKRKENYIKRFNNESGKIIDKMTRPTETLMPSDLSEDERIEFVELFKEHKPLWSKSAKSDTKEIE